MKILLYDYFEKRPYKINKFEFANTFETSKGNFKGSINSDKYFEQWKRTLINIYSKLDVTSQSFLESADEFVKSKEYPIFQKEIIFNTFELIFNFNIVKAVQYAENIKTKKILLGCV